MYGIYCGTTEIATVKQGFEKVALELNKSGSYSELTIWTNGEETKHRIRNVTTPVYFAVYSFFVFIYIY
jgi:hypothetical protein